MLLPKSAGGEDGACCCSAESWPGDTAGQGPVFRADTNLFGSGMWILVWLFTFLWTLRTSETLGDYAFTRLPW